MPRDESLARVLADARAVVRSEERVILFFLVLLSAAAAVVFLYYTLLIIDRLPEVVPMGSLPSGASLP